jgi:molybdopterin-guanine dinucleotide biosynthesis protein B
MAARLISIIGRKNAGKTTLTVTLAAEYVRRGKRVMTIKHGHHDANLDARGTDSWRHYHEGKAERVLLAGPGGRVLFDRAPDLYDPVALARQYLADADVILVEGFKHAAVPKIEVWRKEVTGGPLYAEPGATRSEWIALLTDDETLRADCRVIHFRDTMWLHLLATIAWDEGLELTG